MKITIEGDNFDNNGNHCQFDEVKVCVDDDLTTNVVVMGIKANTIMIAVMMSLI